MARRLSSSPQPSFSVLPSASLLPASSNSQLQQSQALIPVSPAHPNPARLPSRVVYHPTSAGIPWPLFQGGRYASCDPAAPGPRPSRLLSRDVCFLHYSPVSREGRLLQALSSAHRSATVLPWQRPGLTACASAADPSVRRLGRSDVQLPALRTPLGATSGLGPDSPLPLSPLLPTLPIAASSVYMFCLSSPPPPHLTHRAWSLRPRRTTSSHGSHLKALLLPISPSQGIITLWLKRIQGSQWTTIQS